VARDENTSPATSLSWGRRLLCCSEWSAAEPSRRWIRPGQLPLGRSKCRGLTRIPRCSIRARLAVSRRY